MNKNYDFVIIGGGPAGLSAAKVATQRRQSVLVIENKWAGGVCVHEGCIPSKSLVVSCQLINSLRTAEEMGLGSSNYTGRLSSLLTRQREVVAKSYEQLLREINEQNIDLVRGLAKFSRLGEVEITFPEGKKETVHGKKIFIATGSRPKAQDTMPVDGEKILTSSEALQMSSRPNRLVLVGGGYIPCTYASIFSTLGTKVTLIERKGRLLPGFDHTVGQFLERSFSRRGIDVLTNTQVEKTTIRNEEVVINVDNGPQIIADRALAATGRVPNVEDLGLEICGIDLNEGGRGIKVDRRMETSCPGVYAIGDVNSSLPLAHAAIVQGRIAAMNALGEDILYTQDSIPWTVHAEPEIASVGLTEDRARAAGYDVVAITHPFSAIGRAITTGELNGLVKLVASKNTGKLLGGTIIGGEASEMIGQLVTALEMDAGVNDLVRIVTAHPTFSEAIQEATWQLQEKI